MIRQKKTSASSWRIFLQFLESGTLRSQSIKGFTLKFFSIHLHGNSQSVQYFLLILRNSRNILSARNRDKINSRKCLQICPGNPIRIFYPTNERRFLCGELYMRIQLSRIISETGNVGFRGLLQDNGIQDISPAVSEYLLPFLRAKPLHRIGEPVFFYYDLRFSCINLFYFGFNNPFLRDPSYIGINRYGVFLTGYSF